MVSMEELEEMSLNDLHDLIIDQDNYIISLGEELDKIKALLHMIKTVLKVDYEEVPEYRKLILYIDYLETKETRPFEEVIKDFNKI